MGMKPFTFTTQVVLVLETEKVNAIKRNNKIQQLWTRYEINCATEKKAFQNIHVFLW